MFLDVLSLWSFFLPRIARIFTDFFWDALKYVLAEILSLRDWGGGFISRKGAKARSFGMFYCFALFFCHGLHGFLLIFFGMFF